MLISTLSAKTLLQIVLVIVGSSGLMVGTYRLIEQRHEVSRLIAAQSVRLDAGRFSWPNTPLSRLATVKHVTPSRATQSSTLVLVTSQCVACDAQMVAWRQLIAELAEPDRVTLRLITLSSETAFAELVDLSRRRGLNAVVEQPADAAMFALETGINMVPTTMVLTPDETVTLIGSGVLSDEEMTEVARRLLRPNASGYYPLRVRPAATVGWSRTPERCVSYDGSPLVSHTADDTWRIVTKDGSQLIPAVLKDEELAQTLLSVASGYRAVCSIRATVGPGNTPFVYWRRGTNNSAALPVAPDHPLITCWEYEPRALRLKHDTRYNLWAIESDLHRFVALPSEAEGLAGLWLMRRSREVCTVRNPRSHESTAVRQAALQYLQ